jgi:hypothetical protein
LVRQWAGPSSTVARLADAQTVNFDWSEKNKTVRLAVDQD